MLISERDRELNRELHKDPDYGVSGKLYVDAVKRLGELVGTTDALDYGAGKRTLAQLLALRAGWSAAEYDPAVPSISALPEKHDLVVCTDVLEHVSPDRLDAVLAHIASVTGRVAFFAICCEPAKKLLSDGRNAHLIVEGVTWWREKLERHFIMLRVFGKPDGFVFIGQSKNDPTNIADLSEIGPPPEIKTMQGKSIYTDEQRCKNIRSAMLRGLPYVKVLPPHDKVFVLACYGPSLADTMPTLKAEVAAGGDLWSVSGAHEFLISQGVVPMAHVEADPQPINTKRLGAPHSGVAYFCASACSREVLDHLKGNEVWLYHQTSSTPERKLMEQLDQGGGVFTIDGGTQVGMSAIALGSVLGYRRFSIHGMDCSFRAPADVLAWQPDKPGDPMPDDLLGKVAKHAGRHPNPDQFLMRVQVGGRKFMTSGQMAQAVQDYIAMLSRLGGSPSYQFRLHGDGMLRATIEHMRERERADAERLRRIRSAATNRRNGSDALGYAARFTAGLRNTANSKSIADQPARVN